MVGLPVKKQSYNVLADLNHRHHCLSAYNNDSNREKEKLTLLLWARCLGLMFLKAMSAGDSHYSLEALQLLSTFGKSN